MGHEAAERRLSNRERVQVSSGAEQQVSPFSCRICAPRTGRQTLDKQRPSLAIQALDVQEPSTSSRTAETQSGITVGYLGAWGKSEKNNGALFLDNASAAPFRGPAMCSVRRDTSNLARSKANTWKRWLRRGSLAEPVLRHCTNAILSQNTCTVPPAHLFPQTAKLATIGTASLAAMGISIHKAGQGIWSHSAEPRIKAPQPQLPDASEYTVARSGPPGKKPTPFQADRNSCHHTMSPRHSRLSRTFWSCLRGIFIVSIRDLKNGQPGLTTLAAWFKRPMRDWSCLLEATRLSPQVRSSILSRANLSSGSLISWQTPEEYYGSSRAHHLLWSHGESEPTA